MVIMMKRWTAILLALTLVGCGDEFDSLPPRVSNGMGDTIGAGGALVSTDTTNGASDEQCKTANILNTKGVRVIDGDTVEVIPTNGGKSERVRLLGIDAPESSQEYGIKAKATLLQCIGDKIVNIEWVERDKYDRLVGKVIADKTDCNLHQVNVGSAWHYKQYASSQTELDRALYSNAEVNARRNRLGLWQNSDPQAPWDYRAGRATNNNFNSKIVKTTSLSKCYRPVKKETINPITNPSTSTGGVISKPSENFAICSHMVKKTCGQMSSCTEAQQQYSCGNTALDKDGDGTPCEALCKK